MKYIITDKDEVRLGGSFHQIMAEDCEGHVISAGHCEKNPDGTFRVFGESIGYGIKAKQEDATRLQELATK